jgi:hypothetical protein
VWSVEQAEGAEYRSKVVLGLCGGMQSGKARIGVGLLLGSGLIPGVGGSLDLACQEPSLITR